MVLDEPSTGALEGEVLSLVTKRLRNVALAASSLRRLDATLPVCLFTDLSEDQVRRASTMLMAPPPAAASEAKALVPTDLFDVILRDRWSTFEPRTEEETSLLRASSGEVTHVTRKLRSRLGRTRRSIKRMKAS